MEDEPRRDLMKRLAKPLSDPGWETARTELATQGLQLPPAEELSKLLLKAKAEAEAGGTGGGNQPQAANHTPNQSSLPKYQFTKPTDADIQQLKLDLESKNSSLDFDDEVAAPLLAGPDHDQFAQTINYIRYKGISTRKWVPMATGLKTMYRVPDAVQDRYIKLIERNTDEKYVWQGKMYLKQGYDTLDELKKYMAELKALSNNTVSVKVPEGEEDKFKCDKCALNGSIWYEYPRRLAAAESEGPEAVSALEALYDFLCDPYNKPIPGRKNAQKQNWWTQSSAQWWSEHINVSDNEYIVGKAGLPALEMVDYKKKLSSIGYPNETFNVILSEIKNAPTAEEGRAIFKQVYQPGQSTSRSHEVIKMYEEKTAEHKAYLARVKLAEELEAARAAPSG
jgi:hypothetical protein